MPVEPEEYTPPPQNDEQWTFPGVLPHRPATDEPEAAPEVWVKLCSLPLEEANALEARLESEGLPSKLAAIANPDNELPADDLTTVFVLEENLGAAEEVRSHPAQPIPFDDIETPEEREKRKLANWICPKCDKQNLQLLPMSIGWRRYRLACVGIVLLPLLVKGIEWLIPLPSLKSAVNSVPNSWPAFYVFTVVGMAISFARLQRDKRCTACGYCSRKST